jgi:hypothetical protein
MARGDTENAFLAAAEGDEVSLVRARVPWINQRGHFGLPGEARSAIEPLGRIFAALGGIAAEQSAKRMTALPGDFVHEDSGTFIEIDEHQHFTSHRLAALDLYPDDVPLGFDLDEYRELCRSWSPQADSYRRSKAAIGFGEEGRQRQRAYNDSLRDLAAPAMGHPAVVRVAAPDRDGLAAYGRVRNRILALRARGA